MFDPFGDYKTQGYLRNIEGLKDDDDLKVQEHAFFEANVERALTYLHRIRGPIVYSHFLKVHEILFGEFYPWAGRDRHMLGVGRLVGKGKRIQFEASELCQLAVEWGLRLGNDPEVMRVNPGTVMGAFAWGHPFLDGNGRTMLLVHAELCARAGFTINWHASRKDDYLNALSREIENPQGSHLNDYLGRLIVPAVPQGDLLNYLQSLPGLDGQQASPAEDIVYHADDPVANQRYLELKRSRGEPVPLTPER
ncbi:Fic family protein [Dyella flagellata]